MGNRGFTVIEAVVAFALLLFLAAVSLRGALAIGESGSACTAGLVAVRLASSTIAEGRVEGPPSLPCSRTRSVSLEGKEFDLTQRWTGSADPSLWHLRVLIGWEDGGRRRNLAVETWIWSPSRG